MTRPSTPLLTLLGALVAGSFVLDAQVTGSRLADAAREPHNWLNYNGTYASQRYSTLDQITPANVARLESKWVVQNQVFGAWQSNPLVVDGVMYLTQRPNDVMAVDAVTGSLYWLYRHTPSPDAKVCCGANNRGVAILDDLLFMGTLDARLIAIDAVTGKARWNIEVGDVKAGYSITMAPLVVKDKVLVGVGGGEYGIRGFVAAYDAKTGKEVWKFYTIPGPGEPGHDTWEGDDWKTGGAPAWITGSYDPTLNLVYWGIGNPGPDWNPKQRPGDNLYADCAIALDADTGTLKWYFQFTPNDPYDYDSVQVPVLVDRPWKGTPRKLMLWANRNGYFYVLDRVTGEFLAGTPFVKVNWSSGLDAKGRPLLTPQPQGSPTYPGNQGGTNWYVPSYSPRTGLFYFSAWENYGTIYRSEEVEYKPGSALHRRRILGGRAGAGRPHDRHRPARPDQQLDRRSRQRRGDGGRSRHRAGEVEAAPARRERRRDADHGERPALHRRPRRALHGRRCQDRRAAVEGQPRRPDRDGPDHLHGRGQTVPVGHRRPHPGDLRPARLNAYVERDVQRNPFRIPLH